MSGRALAAVNLLGGGVGSAERGRLLLGGEFRLHGRTYPMQDRDIWKLAEEQQHLQDELHGFSWLDDLRAEGGRDAMSAARSWLFEWIDRYSANRRDHFSPQIAGRRAVSWLRNGTFVMAMQDRSSQASFDRALNVHADALRRRRIAGGGGLARIEAAAGRICAEVAGGRWGTELARATGALAKECRSVLLNNAGLASRNPEELLGVLQNLNWAASALHSAGCVPDSDHGKGMRLAAGILKSLRHVNGAMARFHGGGDLPAALPDLAISEAGHTGPAGVELAMGYARVHSGQTSAIIDAARPPGGAASRNAHSCTLAFEVVARGCRLVVNRGPGHWLDQEEQSAARSTGAHSTVEIGGESSSQLETPKVWRPKGVREFANVPGEVRVSQLPGRDGLTVIASHNGYVPSFGLTHMRRLDMARNGRRIWGEDTIWPKPGADSQTHERLAGAAGGFEVASRFHLHPDASVRMLSGQRRIEVGLPNGDAWLFRLEGHARLGIEESAYLDEFAFEVSPSSQIVLHSTTRNGTAQFRWEFRCEPQPA